MKIAKKQLHAEGKSCKGIGCYVLWEEAECVEEFFLFDRQEEEEEF